MEKTNGKQNKRNKERIFYRESDKISIRVAKTKEKIEEFQKFLFQIYCVELQWRDKNDFSDGLMSDKYDGNSSFITVHFGPEIIGGMRMVRNSVMGFPHEKETGVQLKNLRDAVNADTREKMLKINNNNLREITRFAGKKTSKRVLMFDLAKGWYWYCFRNEVEACFMAVDMNLFLLCEKLSIPLKPVGVPKYCEGSWTIPSILIMEDMMASLKEKNTGLWKYIMDGFNIFGDWKD